MSHKFSARFFDGKNIQAKIALVEVLPTGLFLTVENGDSFTWAKEELQLMERPFRDKPAVMGSKSMLGARLVIQSEEAFESILPLISSKNIKLSHVHHPWRVAWILLVGALIVILLPIWNFPLVSLWIAKIIPYSWEQSLWEHEVKNKFEDKLECVSPEGKRALNKIVTKLSDVSNSKHRFDIRVIPAPEFVNAESTPGFHIFIYSGLFNIDTPDGIAGVIAHEMGHSMQHHVIASVINELGIRAFYNSVLGVSNKNIAFDYLNLKYRRDYETQADKIAIELMKKANINPSGFRESMEYLAKQEGDYQGLEPYLIDHPTHKERITLIKKNESTKHYEPVLTPEEWQSLKNICTKTRQMKF